MCLGEPHPFPERGPPTRLSNVGIIKLKRMIRLYIYIYIYIYKK